MAGVCGGHEMYERGDTAVARSLLRVLVGTRVHDSSAKEKDGRVLLELWIQLEGESQRQMSGVWRESAGYVELTCP